jgi:hypothetical protein
VGRTFRIRLTVTFFIGHGREHGGLLAGESGRSKNSFGSCYFRVGQSTRNFLAINQVYPSKSACGHKFSEHAIERIQVHQQLYVKLFCKSLRMLSATCFCHIGQRISSWEGQGGQGGVDRGPGKIDYFVPDLVYRHASSLSNLGRCVLLGSISGHRASEVLSATMHGYLK